MSKARYNSWNHEIPSPQRVVGNLRLRPHIESLLGKVADLLGLGPEARRVAIDATFASAETATDDFELERILKQKLVVGCDRSMMQEAIRQRSIIVFNEIESKFRGHSMLDVGCGNGLISHMAKPHFADVQLLDVVNYVSPEVGLPYLAYTEGEVLPVDRKYDTVLLLTVLHHSSNPMTLLKESWKVTNRRLIIIESVFGVYTQSLSAQYVLAEFEESDQISFAVFVDWLYNRVLNDDIPVPYNFTTPDRWQKTFSECGMPLTETQNLGQDIKIAPELHYLFVLDR